jgi:hypothetical protein
LFLSLIEFNKVNQNKNEKTNIKKVVEIKFLNSD